MWRSWARANNEKFGWHLYNGYDAVAKQLLLPLGVHWLDINQMTHQRPDGHTQFRHGGGTMPPDCMHMTIPGIPDTWNALLIRAVERCLAPVVNTESAL